MKKYSSIIIAVAVFILSNTSYFWGKSSFFIGILFGLITLIGFAVVFILTLFQCYFFYKEKFRKKIRLVNILILAFTLIYCLNFPNIIDFDSRDHGNKIFHAYYEGSANCTTNLILREEKRFTMSIICFGMTEEHGNYEIRNDSIFLTYDNDKFSKDKKDLGIIIRDSKQNNNEPKSILFINKNDTLNRPLNLKITLNKI